MKSADADGRDPSRDVQLVLFDLSGVLAEFHGAHALGELIGLPEEQVWPRWLESPWMRRFDAGVCSQADFAQGVVEEWALEITPADLVDAFAGWMIGPYPGAEALVRRTRSRVPVGCLSNMNPLHWRELEGWPLISAFDHSFISCELGLVKPDPEIYAHAAGAVGLTGQQILFLDDNLINVNAAIDAGLHAAHVRGVGGAEQALLERGIVGPSLG